MPKWLLAPISPVSVSLALPDRVVTNAELCQDLDTTPEWIEEKTGIKERRFLEADETVSDFAVEAARKAIADAGLTADQIDVLIVACTTPDWLMPSLGVCIADRLGIVSPRIVDITQHACASSVYATYQAACLLQEPGLETALIVCAERGSGGTDPLDRTTRIFFGDAAGAIVFRKSDTAGGLLSYDLGNTYSDAVRMATSAQLRLRPAAPGYTAPRGPYLEMDGKTVWQEATTRLPKSIHETLSLAGLDVADVNGFALHQANAKLVEYIGRTMGVDPERTPITADTLGNTASVSPVTSLWRLAHEGRAKRGDTVVLAAIGAGFLWGSLCFELQHDIECSRQ